MRRSGAYQLLWKIPGERHLPLARPHIRSLHYTSRVRQQAQGHGPSAEITSEYRVHRVQAHGQPLSPYMAARRILCTAGYRSGPVFLRYRIDQYGGSHHRCARVAAPSLRRGNRALLPSFPLSRESRATAFVIPAEAGIQEGRRAGAVSTRKPRRSIRNHALWP